MADAGGGEQGDSGPASAPDAETTTDGGVTTGDAGPGSFTISGKGTSVFPYAYALNFGDTIEVHFSKAPAPQDAQQLVLLYMRGDSSPDYTYSHSTFRGSALCQLATLQSKEPGVDDGQPLLVAADGRITGGPVHVSMPVVGDFVAQFSDAPAPAATYACP